MVVMTRVLQASQSDMDQHGVNTALIFKIIIRLQRASAPIDFRLMQLRLLFVLIAF